MAYGTLSSADTLRSSQQTIAQYGEDRAFADVEVDRQANNLITRDLLSSFVEITTDRQRRYGAGGGMVMDEVTEFDRADAQKTPNGSTIGIPLRLFQISVQWTRKFMQNTTVDQLQAQFTDARRAYLMRMQREIKRAIFTGTNATFIDRLVDSVSLPLKAFLNADGSQVPVGPNGETFNGSTHTHYLYTASTSVANADVVALILTVTEHYAQGKVRLEIAAAQEAAVRALSGFIPITPVQFVQPTSVVATYGEYDRMNINNRMIGYYGTNYAEVWVKPWVIPGYLFAYVEGAPVPLVMRERDQGSSGLQIAAEDENYPLRAQTLEAEFGASVWNRTNGAVLYIDTGAAGAYVSPTIN